MIVPMKKITILVAQQNISIALKRLRKLGVVHIEHIRIPQSESISAVEGKLVQIDHVLGGFNESTEDEAKNFVDDVDIEKKVEEISSLVQQKQKLTARQQELGKNCEWFDEWGDITHDSLDLLRRKGIFVKLYRCPKKLFEKEQKKKILYKVKDDGKTVHCALITEIEEDSINANEVKMPSVDIKEVRNELNTVSAEIDSINEKINEARRYEQNLIQHKEELLKTAEMENVRFGMAEEDGFNYLQGYCPEELLDDVKEKAEEQGWGIISEDPGDIKKVPTLIRYPRFVKIIEPVFNFIGTVPGYGEYDISLWFLVFLSLFFAILIGDAGYGLLFLIIAFFARRKLPDAPKQVFFLMYTFAISTVLWGAITGNWFGAEQIARLPVFNNLVVPKLNSFVDANQLVLMYVCFLIGAIHLTIAHGIIVIRYIKSFFALANIGWICIVWGIFYLACNLVLDDPFPDFAKYLLIVGIGLVVLFANFQKNIFKGIGLSIADLPLSLIGSFGDTLSYLRLFAVGFASVMIAVSFNNMALEVGFNSFFSSLGAAVILFLGHSLNIILALMSVLVHGIRLNMLEFSGHLDMQWSGKEYKPFKE